MLVRKLSYLVALAQEKHFGRAAQRCHISQPALSAAIQSLEQELDVSIVQRHKNRFQGFTVEGLRVLTWAQRMLADFDSLRQDLKSANPAELSGKLKIGAIPSTLPLIPKLVQHSLRHLPGVHYEIVTLSSLEILRSLGNHELDIGISYMNDARLKHFSSLCLFRERYVLMYSRKQASLEYLVTNDYAITWRQAARLPLCLFTENLQCRQGINRVFSDIGVEVKPLVETDSLAVLYGQIVHGGLYGIVPHSILCYGISLGDEIVVRPMQNLLQRDIGLIIRSQKLHSKLLDTALESMYTTDLQTWVDSFLPAS